MGKETSYHTNTYAILSLVFAFIFFPLGLVFGIVALRQIKKTHEDGHGLAVAGVVLSLLGLLGFLTILTLFGVFVGTVASVVPSDVNQLTDSVRALDEAIIGNNDKVNTQKSPVSNADVNSIIKERCAKEWPKDFNMRAYCQEQQTIGYNNLLTTAPTGMSDLDFQIIKKQCEEEWGTDYGMRVYCEKQQVEGWRAVK